MSLYSLLDEYIILSTEQLMCYGNAIQLYLPITQRKVIALLIEC